MSTQRSASSYSINGMVEFLSDPGREKTSLTMFDSSNQNSLDLSAYNNVIPTALKVGKKLNFSHVCTK